MTDPVESLLRLAGARPAPPAERMRRVRAAVHAEWARGVERRRRRTLGVVALLATAAAVILALGLSRRASSPLPAVTVAVLERVTGAHRGLPIASRIDGGPAVVAIGDGVPAGAVVETDGAARAALRLSSGASIRLDTRTRLSFRSGIEVFLERGAIYVDTPPGAAALEVHTPKGVARELGTQFEIRVLEPEVRVRVREGIVRLRQDERSEDARRGDELRTEGTEIARGAVPVYGEAWSWVLDVAPPFMLEGRTLAEFLAWACRENGWTLEYADAASSRAARETLLHGSVEALTPAQAVEAVLPTSGFVGRSEGHRLVVGRGGH